MADEKITNADYVDVTTTDNKEMNEKTSVVPVTSHEPYDAISHNINIGEFSANPAVRSYCTLACWFFFFFFFRELRVRNFLQPRIYCYILSSTYNFDI